MIQKMLDENTILINTIIEYQQQGRHQETYDYQVKKGMKINGEGMNSKELFLSKYRKFSKGSLKTCRDTNLV